MLAAGQLPPEVAEAVRQGARVTVEPEGQPEPEPEPEPEPAVVGKVGRNEPCPCGSGKKYKKCHGKAG
jgi:uncharacterized protein YecA (UPF0149 family)